MIKVTFTHKPIETDGLVIDNTKSPLDHRLYSEIAGFKILFDMIEKGEIKDEWISLNHYRRAIDPDCTGRIYIPEPMILKNTVGQQYDMYHNIDDLILCGQAMKETHPHLVPWFETVINGNMFIPYNMGVMPVNQFKDYFTFLYTVLTKTMEKLNIKTYEEMIERVKNNAKYRGHADDRVEYQSRVPSFLAERLSTLYWIFCSKQCPVFPAKVLLLEKDQKI